MYCFSYLDAPPGAGKTFVSLKKIKLRVACGQKVIVCQPSKKLIRQTVKALKTLDKKICIKEIHGGTHTFPVQAIRDYLNDPHAGPHVLFITWAAFERLEFAINAKDWHLIVDEIPQGHRHFEIPLASNHGLLTDHLKLGAATEFGYHQLLPDTKEDLKDIIKGSSHDAVNKIFQGVAATIISNHWKTYVNEKTYTKLLRDRKNIERFSAFSVLQPSIFANFGSVTILGADFENSMLYLIWSKMDVTFVKLPADDLRYQNLDHVKSLTILCSIEQSFPRLSETERIVLFTMQLLKPLV
jgi:hypothetical protein